MLVADAVADTRRHVYGSAADQVTLLAADYTAGSDEVMIDTTMGTEGITKGSVISMGLNVMFVKGVATDNTGTVYVIPGFQGSPLEDVAAGAFVWIKPRMTEWQVFSTISDIISYLSSPMTGLYKVGSWDAYTDPTFQTYVIPTGIDVLDMLAVRALYPGSVDTYVDVPMQSVQWQPLEGTVRLTYDVTPTTITFIYRGPFTKPTSLTDDLETVCGLTATMLDLPALGAAVRLLRTTESRREQISMQGDPRRASEVLAGSNSAAANQMQREFQARIDGEYLRLVSQYSINLGV